ncbi:MAG: proline--tRNA ligase [Desulfovibrionaceae bacterium]|nr:proline--tRNA ligase [Desulfovibrionaceae bacterium]
MRFSQYYIPTLKEAPADAEVVSHKLLVRAGMIRKLTSGIYTYLPLGVRALERVSRIVREEMNKAGALEIFMPTVQPSDLWEESGRWQKYGKELLRFKDRNDRDYCLGPTHEEVVTSLLRGEIRSYRQMPINVYQIQTKFRDEIRPRFGLMRGREFIMKDAYSFDRDNAGADKSYEIMYRAYENIFRRMGLKFRAVEADSGAIGGNFSHEFMVLADTGEDVIAVATDGTYAANLERAEATYSGPEAPLSETAYEEVSTPDCPTVEAVCKLLNVPAAQIVKTMLYNADGEIVAALVRGDREVNEIKLKNLVGAVELNLVTAEEIAGVSAGNIGSIGPVGLNVRIFADLELLGGNDWIVGANKPDAHLIHVDFKRDAKIEAYKDLRQVQEGDPCPRGGGKLTLTRGIEVGHVFKLGLKYSEAMNAKFLDENGKEQFMVMGSYGIGISRVVAAAIEQNHDEFGIKFPPPLAPFQVSLLNLDIRSEKAVAKADEIYEFLESEGLETLYDDRDERPGVKFKDADLLGSPIQLVVGGKGLDRGIIEAKDRRTNEKFELSLENFKENFKKWQADVWAGWGL